MERKPAMKKHEYSTTIIFEGPHHWEGEERIFEILVFLSYKSIKNFMQLFPQFPDLKNSKHLGKGAFAALRAIYCPGATIPGWGVSIRCGNTGKYLINGVSLIDGERNPAFVFDCPSEALNCAEDLFIRYYYELLTSKGILDCLRVERTCHSEELHI